MTVGGEGTGFPVDLSRGVCYLVEEKKPDLSYRLLRQLLSEPLPGLVITRQYPDRVRRERGLTDVKVVWLGHTPGGANHNPTAIGTRAQTNSRLPAGHGGGGRRGRPRRTLFFSARSVRRSAATDHRAGIPGRQRPVPVCLALAF